MTRKPKIEYRCQSCGYTSAKWHGQCPRCREYDTFEALENIKRHSGHLALQRVNLRDVRPPERWVSGIEEWDRVLGGGLVPGGTYLLGGEPGIGKSTLMLQVLACYLKKGLKALYVAGEESPDQIAQRVQRLDLDLANLELTTDTRVEVLTQTIHQDPWDLIVVDSVQMLTDTERPYRAGSQALMRSAVHQLVQAGKSTGTAIVFIGHVTKEGHLAGPRMLEHMVDGVFYFEGDRQLALRMVRATKHRFGPADEVGLFEMTEKGLKPISNPATRWVDFDRESARVGGILCPILEGIRCLVVEIQALVAPTVYATGRRTALGVDVGRVHTVCALLERHLKIPLSRYDVYIKLSGGLRTNDPGLDLALAIALFSSYENLSVPMTWAAFGELTLTGRTRAVSFMEKRLSTIERLGLTTVFIPGGERASQVDMNVCVIDEVRQFPEMLPAFHP